MLTDNGRVKARTKAETLAHIRSLGLVNGQVLPLFYVTYKQWSDTPENVLDQISQWYSDECRTEFPGAVLIRSSTLGEDNNETTNAGKFLTLQNVAVDRDALREAVTQVFGSYEDSVSDLDQVLIQPQLKDIESSGVLLTRDLSSFAPYDTVSFDDKSTNCADAVTSGSGNVKTWYKFKNNKEILHQKQFTPLLAMAREVEQIFGHDHVDIEFAICKHPSKENESVLFLLQARTLLDKSLSAVSTLSEEHIHAMISKFRVASQKYPGSRLLGDFTLFSTMTDWNPAEIIGCEPRMLARTLYQNIITDRVWAQQRRDYGYRDVVGFPLITTFNGVPFVDVRVDFNSWIPKDIPTEIAEKLVNFYLHKLKSNPEMHDKVEFDIVFTCYFPGIRNKLIKDLQSNNKTAYTFSDEEITVIEKALFTLTSRILEPATTYKEGHEVPSTAVVHDHYSKINELEERRTAILNSDLNDVQKIYWLIEEMRVYGTLPFAGLARCGFVAVQYLRALQASGTISRKEFGDFMASLDTVTKRLSLDVEQFNSGKITQEEFLKTYGHLRPGTYDVLSARYDEAFDLYFNYNKKSNNTDNNNDINNDNTKPLVSAVSAAVGGNVSSDNSENEGLSISRSMSPILDHHSLHPTTNPIHNMPVTAFSTSTLEKISAAFNEMDLKSPTPVVLKFLKEAIEGREYSKFIFTRCLSDVLSLIVKFGESHGLTRDDISFLRIDTILKLYNEQRPTDQKLKDALRAEVERHKSEYFTITQSVLLPPLLVDESEFYEFYQFRAAPNFITNKRVVANVMKCDSPSQSNLDVSKISGSVAFISSADPGYDWLFTHNIAGLVTQYGGLNSHMSIRCAELGIPAIIGSGDKNFHYWRKAHCIDIDCANKVVSIVS